MAKSWTVLRLCAGPPNYFASKGIDNRRLDAELLLADMLELDRVGLYLNYDRPLQAAELAAFRATCRARRAARAARLHPRAVPSSGRCRFKVDPGGADSARRIPRLLVEEALKRAAASGTVLDVGIGSGAIAVAIAHERPDVHGDGHRPVRCRPWRWPARMPNATAWRSGSSSRQGDLFAPRRRALRSDRLQSALHRGRGAGDGLMPEVRDFEPQLALDRRRRRPRLPTGRWSRPAIGA